MRSANKSVHEPAMKTVPSQMRALAVWLMLCFVLSLFAGGVQAAPVSAPPLSAPPIPALSAHVTDQVHLLQPQQRATLEQVLKDYEQKTGNQIALLLISSTAPESIDQYSIRVADAWKLGRKGVDDGVLLIVAKDNPAALRRMRLEAGRGIQGTVTDAQSNRILQDVIAPYFRKGDFYGGLSAGVAALTVLLDQEHFPAPPPAQAAAQAHDASLWASLWPLLIFGLWILISIKSRGGRGGLARNGWGSAAGVILGTALGGGFGGRGGSSGGGGGFGGGGFSGGGGGFDGGGASGNW